MKQQCSVLSAVCPVACAVPLDPVAVGQVTADRLLQPPSLGVVGACREPAAVGHGKTSCGAAAPIPVSWPPTSQYPCAAAPGNRLLLLLGQLIADI